MMIKAHSRLSTGVKGALFVAVLSLLLTHLPTNAQTRLPRTPTLPISQTVPNPSGQFGIDDDPVELPRITVTGSRSEALLLDFYSMLAGMSIRDINITVTVSQGPGGERSESDEGREGKGDSE
ncbi:MAG: hypothetical protein ACRETF_03780, partial [Nevskiaceae bacterium]